MGDRHLFNAIDDSVPEMMREFFLLPIPLVEKADVVLEVLWTRDRQKDINNCQRPRDVVLNPLT